VLGTPTSAKPSFRVRASAASSDLPVRRRNGICRLSLGRRQASSIAQPHSHTRSWTFDVCVFQRFLAQSKLRVDMNVPGAEASLEMFTDTYHGKPP
jgi:hypothetical protein